MTALPREVFKWLQSLDLTFPIRNVRRDLSNGYIVAEIFSWYFPQDIQMHNYDNCSGLPGKLGNWSQLKTFFKRRNIEIPEELIDGTLHCKTDAAELLVQFLYTKLTNRKVKRLALGHDIDFTDHAYQLQLPMHARSTASTAVKTNLKITEFQTAPNIITCQQKAQEIIHKHIQHRQEERLEDPEHFDIKPTIGQKCVRRPPPANTYTGEDVGWKDQSQAVSRKQNTSTRKRSPEVPSNAKLPSATNVTFREIRVSQMDHTSQPALYPVASLSSSPVLPPIGSQS
ncbi:spermatogenesis-associated protein 4-like [Acanthaster planci]|uniref:Spermatogenesis-associated protein 4 n=1 Tax=Acanthaster planci TaxID=133434 RepID=A0A8B7ZXA2_ACAPL|nr:spermatogenesis-associated protein 4-like [Acanthaster planci]